MLNQSHNSCGIREYQGVNGRTPEQILGDFRDKIDSGDCAYVTFSNPVNAQGYKNFDGVPFLYALRDYITENGLGKVDYLAERTNPNSRRKIGFLIWHFDKKEFIKIWDKKFPPVIMTGKKFRIVRDSCNHGLDIDSVVEFGHWYTLYSGRKQAFVPKDKSVYVKLSDVVEITE